MQSTSNIDPGPTIGYGPSIDPGILWALLSGRKAVIISTTHPDGTTNLAPVRYAWWRGLNCLLGPAFNTQTTLNLLRTKECVLNVPSDAMLAKVDELAMATARQDRYSLDTAAGQSKLEDKFSVGHVTRQTSQVVAPFRVLECSVQLEAKLVAMQELQLHEENGGFFQGMEVEILRVHVEKNAMQAVQPGTIDADNWMPLSIYTKPEVTARLNATWNPKTLAEIEAMIIDEKKECLKGYRL